MIKIKKLFTLFMIVSLLLLITYPIESEKWEPFQFEGTERFEYLIELYNGQKANDNLHYIIDLKPTDNTNENGEKLYKVSYTRVGYISESGLDDQIFFGYSGFEVIGFFINPMYYPMISDLDIKVGEETLIYGIGTIKITGKEKINGREGFICELYSTGNKEILMAIFTIAPKIPVPLKVIVYNDVKEINSEVILVEYRE